MISHRYAKANNPYMKSYDKSKESSYIQYLDANNLYGHSMCQKLPYGDFQWRENMNNEQVTEYDCSGENGCFVECDIEYPEHLHEQHNNCPLAPESRAVMKTELSPYYIFQLESHKEKHSEKIKKIIPNLYNKKNMYVILRTCNIILQKCLS